MSPDGRPSACLRVSARSVRRANGINLEGNNGSNQSPLHALRKCEHCPTHVRPIGRANVSQVRASTTLAPPEDGDRIVIWRRARSLHNRHAWKLRRRSNAERSVPTIPAPGPLRGMAVGTVPEGVMFDTAAHANAASRDSRRVSLADGGRRRGPPASRHFARRRQSKCGNGQANRLSATSNLCDQPRGGPNPERNNRRAGNRASFSNFGPDASNPHMQCRARTTLACAATTGRPAARGRGPKASAAWPCQACTERPHCSLRGIPG